MAWIEPEVTKKPRRPMFLCVLSNTKTAHIPKLSAAGKTAELTDYTPAGDAELMETGNIISVPVLPMTPPYDTPTPAIMTRSALKLTDVPYHFINSGLIVTPEGQTWGRHKGTNCGQGCTGNLRAGKVPRQKAQKPGRPRGYRGKYSWRYNNGYGSFNGPWI